MEVGILPLVKKEPHFLLEDVILCQKQQSTLQGDFVFGSHVCVNIHGKYSFKQLDGFILLYIFFLQKKKVSSTNNAEKVSLNVKLNNLKNCSRAFSYFRDFIFAFAFLILPRPRLW